jgi:hypothetical protein
MKASLWPENFTSYRTVKKLDTKRVRLLLTKSSQAISRVSSLTTTSGSRNICPHHQGNDITDRKMGTEMVLQTLVVFNELTWLIVREDFIYAN